MQTCRFRIELQPKVEHMSNLPYPEFGFVRLSQIIGDSKVEPPVPPVIPVFKSIWRQGVMDGRFPKSVKLGPRITVWRAEEVRALVKNADWK
jgi:prophage regulatory protein